MKVFLIIVAVLVVLTILILSISAEATVVYDKGWNTTVQVLFFKRDVELSKILNFVLFPDKAGKKAAEKINDKNSKDKVEKNNKDTDENKSAQIDDVQSQPENEKSSNGGGNFITKIIDEDGIVGVMLLASNLIETVNTAGLTLFRGLHIHSLYVKIIVGGGDAADIGNDYGTICGIYYPIKGVILNGMKVDRYDDYIQADFIAPSSEYEFQLIASMSVGLVLKIGLKAGMTFLVNLFKNKK